VLAQHQALESKYAALLKEHDGCKASLQTASAALQAHEVEVQSVKATYFQLQQVG
jgi:hypothetical protein